MKISEYRNRGPTGPRVRSILNSYLSLSYEFHQNFEKWPCSTKNCIETRRFNHFLPDILHKETKRVEFCLECATFQFFFDKYGRKIGWANSISVSQREGGREGEERGWKPSMHSTAVQYGLCVSTTVCVDCWPCDDDGGQLHKSVSVVHRVRLNGTKGGS